ncbi:MAG: FAD binding domain-containing protein [Gammaproteobacteria bacterium]
MALTNLQEYHRPDDMDAVVQLLQQYQDGAMIVAGGTFLHGLVARGLVSDITALIDVRGLGYDHVSLSGGILSIGATATFARLESDADIGSHPALGAIKDALAYPPMQIKNTATVGGCISASCPFFDLPTAFLALNATITALGKKGTRHIPIKDFFPGLFENALYEDEFMLQIDAPVTTDKSASAFIKLETNANDLAILNVAAKLDVDDAGVCQQACIYVGGGVGETAVRAGTAEAALTGAKPGADSIAKAAQAAQDEVQPLDDHRASAAYRKRMAGVLLGRTLEQVEVRLSA